MILQNRHYIRQLPGHVPSCRWGQLLIYRGHARGHRWGQPLIH